MSNAVLWEKVKKMVAEVEAAKKAVNPTVVRNGKKYNQIRVNNSLIRRRPVEDK